MLPIPGKSAASHLIVHELGLYYTYRQRFLVMFTATTLVCPCHCNQYLYLIIFFRRHWINLVIVIAFTCYAYEFPLSPSLVRLLPSFC